MINVQFINNVELLIFLFGSICVTKPKYSHSSIGHYREKIMIPWSFYNNKNAMCKKANKTDKVQQT